MTDAYWYISEGQHSPEIDLLHKIDRFGVMAIMGRPVLYFGETRRMIAAENIVTAYQTRTQSENWAEWAKQNPRAAEMLAEVEKQCHYELKP